MEQVLERIRLSRTASVNDALETGQHDTSSSRGLTALIAAGAALLTLGVLLGWQSWSNRSAPPIDDQLPFLTPESAGGEERSEGAADEEVAAGLEAVAAAAAPPVTAATEQPVSDVVVHVAGAVARPGVVTLPPGSRVYQAIELTGGASDDADLDRVNLAAPVTDGERIHVPAVGEEVVPPVALPSLTPALVAPTAPLDINTASAVELEELPGIGPSLAEAIVTTRFERGPFRSVEELLEVPGIGTAKLEQLRDQGTI